MRERRDKITMIGNLDQINGTTDRPHAASLA
jgi:hypothetical protein